LSEIKTVKIKIWGIVQGVGFRPFVAKLADRLQMKGEVLNIGGLVDIVVTDTDHRIRAFMEALKEEKPLPAEIVHMKIEETERKKFIEFTILDSDEGDDEAAMIPADLAICPDCLAELRDENNPRHLHPFISCMVCGPRYTIIDKIPYDRENTAMIEFPMCDFCNGEYTDRKDRRYHAQTISCHDCGPMLEFRLTEAAGRQGGLASLGFFGKRIDQKIMDRAVLPVALAADLVDSGKIIALKGVGGYHLVCSPFIGEAVKNLRALKVREEKPFAVMFRDMEQIREYCRVSGEEESLLISSARPIVLLERKSTGQKREICPDVYKTSRFIGAFLPGMGLQHMLLEACGPLIMTSANLSDMPIIKDEEEMFDLQEKLKWQENGEKLLSAVFYNKRKIRIRLDDSVVRVIDGQPQMIRRSKGYAPVPLYVNQRLAKEDMILATGGQLKSSFALSKGPFSYVSQYFGDLDSREAGQIYSENVDRMADLFRIRPSLVVCDLHPLYFTTGYGAGYAEKHGAELLQVQHHHAHVASVMAEHNLAEPVLGVSFDGTGYGTDGAIWGGEFLICEGTGFRRAAHLEYIKMLGGDSSMKEGWKSAYSYLYHYLKQEEQEGRSESLEQPEDPRWPTVKAGLANNINTVLSSSMGRLFDGVAAFAGIHDYNRYEGECAIMLENEAADAQVNGLAPLDMNFSILNDDIVSARDIFNSIEAAGRDGTDKRRIALGFHFAVADMILAVCKRTRKRHQISTVALTGGVFQNRILMERALFLLREEGFSVFYNVSVGPNDGGICLGQNYIGMKYLTEK
jgi:hydrogenase maturation protein HypF